MRVRAKICGITNLDDALQAIDAGADALGFVFYPPSPRYIPIEDAILICQQLPPFVTRVGLFVDAERKLIERVSESTAIDLLQFHGDEKQEDCLGFSIPYIKAIRVRSETDFTKAENEYETAAAILVDAYKPGIPGGTGERFDWSLLPVNRKKPLILAGGLDGKNIVQAIRTVHPYAVDVSGGVERSKGIKDHQLVSQFLDEVSRACE